MLRRDATRRISYARTNLICCATRIFHQKRGIDRGNRKRCEYPVIDYRTIGFRERVSANLRANTIVRGEKVFGNFLRGMSDRNFFPALALQVHSPNDVSTDFTSRMYTENADARAQRYSDSPSGWHPTKLEFFESIGRKVRLDGHRKNVPLERSRAPLVSLRTANRNVRR